MKNISEFPTQRIFDTSRLGRFRNVIAGRYRLLVRIDEMDRQIKLGGTAELAFVPVSNNSDGSFFIAQNTVLKGGNGYDGI